MHWGRLLTRPSGGCPAPVGGFVPRCCSLGSGGFRGGGGGHLARSSGTVSARSLGMGPLVAAVGTPLVDSVSSLPCPVLPGRGLRRRWSAPRAPEGAVLVRQDRCSAVGTPCRRAFGPGCCALWAVLAAVPTRWAPLSQRYRHGGPRFHSDASAFTGIPRFASVITLAKCRFPFENSASLAKQTPTPDQGVRLPFENATSLAKQPERPAGGETPL